MLDLARDIIGSQPILTAFLAIGLGYLVGQISIAGFSLGVGAVLFFGLAPYADLVGVASGATGNPAILVYSTKTAPTDRPDIGYAMIFPSMTLVKVIAA